jgi:hypothetical protein
MIRIVCKETLQSLVTTFANMELEIRVKRFTKMTEAVADYVGKEYSKEMKLLVKNHQKENEPKEPVMPGKEEAESPSVMKKYKKIRQAQRKDICDYEGTMHPRYEEQQSGEPKGPQFNRSK